MKTDEQIKKDVIDQLYWDSSVDASKVKVEVKDGEVTLGGTVPSYSSRSSAETDACMVRGVASVDNDLKVEYLLDIPTDEEIKKKIEDNLFWNTLIDEKDIQVSVETGMVTLEGSVDMYWKKTRAEEIADVNGVITITNKLAIVPSEKKSDKDIADDIVGALSRNALIDIDDVDVEVDNGVATLTGEVRSWSAYRAAEDAAFYTLGVVEVNNDLVISYT
jgi:osmotically-inducible protein OsmY